jgi:ATPase family associated with various cellular activities (AAA).
MKGILEKLLGKPKEENPKTKSQSIYIKDIEITPGYLEQDKDARIEEYWVETMAISEDGYWFLAGRRHGLFSLYKYNGALVRLPARPPSQAVVNIVFRDKFLAISSPPYVSVHEMIDPYNPKSWKSIKLTQEGLRPAGGLDIGNGLLIYGAISNQVVIVELDFDKGVIEPKNIIRLQDFDQIKFIKILRNRNIIVSGPKKTVVIDVNGNILQELSITSSCATFKDDILYLVGNELIGYNVDTKTEVFRYPLSCNPNDIDVYEHIALIADKEENRLTFFDTKLGQEMGVLEDGGYSVVKVSPDGSIYTSFVDRENKLYYLRKFDTNLLDLYYPKERQEAIRKNAQKLYRDFKKRLNNNETEDIPELKELKTLMSYPFKDIRELIEKAEEELYQKIIELKFEAFKSQIPNINAKIYEELQEFGKNLDERYQKAFEKLQKEALESLKNLIEKHIKEVEQAISKNSIANQIEAESLEEVKRAREVFLSLPRDIQPEAFDRLNKLIQRFIISRRLEKYKIEIDNNTIKIADVKVEIPQNIRKKLKWQLKLEEKLVIEQKLYSKVSFVREDGIIREPKRYNNYLTIDEMRHKPKWIARYLSKLNGLFGYQDSSILNPTVSFEDTPWFVQNLAMLSKALNEQLKYNEGIVIIEGDAGVGKNFLIEVYSALTRRPLFIIPCHSKMEKEDITFVYEYDPKIGTKRTKSNLIKALETPNAIIFFDEINTLPTSLVKVFNPLFDYRRYMYLSYDSIVKAEKNVLFVGAMNPQNYLGVSELPQDIKSRADILYIDYPPFEDEKGFYYPDEALILKDYVAGFEGLTKEDFIYLWYDKINGINHDKAINISEITIKNLYKIFELLKIASSIRRAYRDYQSGQSEEAIDFVFSMRDTIRCARKLNESDNVKEVVKSTILPKVSNLFERKSVETLIDDA